MRWIRYLLVAALFFPLYAVAEGYRFVASRPSVAAVIQFKRRAVASIAFRARRLAFKLWRFITWPIDVGRDIHLIVSHIMLDFNLRFYFRRMAKRFRRWRNL